MADDDADHPQPRDVPTPRIRRAWRDRDLHPLLRAASLLLVMAVAPAPAFADISPVPDISPILGSTRGVRPLILLFAFVLTLVIEGLIVILPLRRQVHPLRRLVAVFVAANAISFTALTLLLMRVPSYQYDTAYLVGEIGVAIFEGAFVSALIRRKLIAERAAVRSRPFLAVFVLVVVANGVTGLIRMPLSWTG